MNTSVVPSEAEPENPPLDSSNSGIGRARTSLRKSFETTKRMVSDLADDGHHKTKKVDILKHCTTSIAIVLGMSAYGCSITQLSVVPMIQDHAALYFGAANSTEFWPSAFSADHEFFPNVTVAPAHFPTSDAYFVDSRAIEYPPARDFVVHGIVSFMLCIAFWSMSFLDKPKTWRQGTAAVTVVIAALVIGMVAGVSVSNAPAYQGGCTF